LWVIFGYSVCLLVGVFVLFQFWIGVGNGFFFFICFFFALVFVVAEAVGFFDVSFVLYLR